VVFTTTGDRRRVHRLWLDLMAFDKRPDVRNPRRLAAEALTAGASLEASPAWPPSPGPICTQLPVKEA
jgi:hypothetical protein